MGNLDRKDFRVSTGFEDRDGGSVYIATVLHREKIIAEFRAVTASDLSFDISMAEANDMANATIETLMIEWEGKYTR